MRRTTLPNIKKTAWKWCSIMTRLKFANDVGQCQCVTCGDWHIWKEIDAGHFISKNKGNSVYFDEMNLHPQCPSCNRVKSGNLVEYSSFIIETYGMEGFNRLKELPQTKIDFNIPLLEEMRDDFKARAKQYAAEKGLRI